ncbi:hypothetical protein P692DRAFT_20826986, partial [Suillus brevipes Sb2]
MLTTSCISKTYSSYASARRSTTVACQRSNQGTSKGHVNSDSPKIDRFTSTTSQNSPATHYTHPMAKKKSVIRAQNIVIFGAMGAGKSSLVNLIADQNIAKTGSDLKRCTLTWTKYVLPRLFNDEQQYNIFDTMGIENPEIESPEYHQSIQNASQLLRELDDCGGTSLLVYCVEKSRDARHAFKSNYQLFHEVLYQRRVPIVMVVTCLEGEEVMEDWWERNRASLEASEIVVAGHACITTLKDEAKYEASREAVRELIRRHAAGTPVRGG